MPGLAYAEESAAVADPKKRKIYDQHGKEGLKGNHVDPEDLFKHMFPEQETEVPDLRCELELTFEQIFNGCTVEKEVERVSLCTVCFGSGTKNGIVEKCKICEGKGSRIAMVGPGMMMKIDCDSCRGTGKKNDKNNECKKCYGNQVRKEYVKIKVTVEPGVHQDYPIVVQEEGHAVLLEDMKDSGDKKRSDVIFFVKEKPHNLFKRKFLKEKGKIDMSDLAIELDISFGESIVGFHRKLNHLNNDPFDIVYNKASRHGDIFIMKGFGMPILESDKKGDLFISLKVEHPQNLKLEDNEKEILCNIFDVNIPKNDKPMTKIISYEKYIEEYKEQNSSENMRRKYDHRRTFEDGQGQGFNVNQCAQQ